MIRIYAGSVSGNAEQRAAGGNAVVETVLASLREHGGRATSARRLLLEVLVGSHGHHSADELAALVQARGPEINTSTIYRNLDELRRLQVIDRTCPGQGPATYHLANGSHGHLVCEDCGALTEIPGQFFADLAQRAYEQYGFTVQPRKSAVTGQCAQCRTRSH